MTSRGRIALGLGVLTYLCAWAFGSKPLYPVAVGLLLAVFVAWAWVGLANRPMRLHRALQGGDHVEGDDVMVKLELERDGGLAPGSLVIRERIAKVGERHTPLQGRHVRYRLAALPRGRYAFESASAVIEDGLGLQRAEVPLQSSGAILVYPRLVELDRLFSESGSHAQDGRRLLLRRPSGFDLHSVREYTESDSLRAVHWRSTAKRGRADGEGARGRAARRGGGAARRRRALGRGRAAGLELRRAGARRGVDPARARPPQPALGADRELGRARRAAGRRLRRRLAARARAARLRRADRPRAGREPARGRGRAGGARARARGRDRPLEPGLVDRLLQRALARRSVSLVWIDAASFANGSSRSRREPLLLRLQAAGVPVAVVRRGDDLAAALSAPEREVAHA